MKLTHTLLASRFHFIIAVIVLRPMTVVSESLPLKPINLRCEYIVNPISIDNSNPRFSWNFELNGRNQSQRAYEVIVSKDLAKVSLGNADSWSSGKVASGENINIVYMGETLASFTRYFWSVRCYNENNEPGPWSSPAFFQTAMLKSVDWQAKWIGDGSKNPENDADAFKPDRMPLFRKGFVAPKKVLRATLAISGLGYYEAYLNGKKISDHMLDPGWTTYSKEVLYAVHDVTEQVTRGENMLAVMLGNGWWNPVPIKFFGRWDLRLYQQTGRPCFTSQLILVYEDGAVEYVNSDNSWLTAPGPVYKNSVYLGEHYDARWEQAHWNDVGKISSEWRNAVVVEGPSGKLSAQRQPPVRITKIIKPIKISQPKRDTFIVDMGQNFAGVARIKVKGKKGQKITLRYGEGIFKDGSLNVSTTVMTQIRKGGIPAGPGAPPTAWQEDSYTLKGEGLEVWNPRFTFHGFRYVEVVGWKGSLSVNDIEGLRMNSDLQDVSEFACSNDMLNNVQQLVDWTFLSNVFSVQSDCPAREKMGYGADIVVTANAFIYNYDMANFYRKTVKDFANEQLEDGGVTEIAPFTGIADRGYGGNSGPLGWQLAFPFVQKQLYDFYGDKKVIEENYPRLQRQINFLKEKAVQGLFHWDIGDHEALDPRAEAFSASAFYFHHLLLASEFAGILSKKEDSIAFANAAANVKKLIVRKYYVPNSGRFDNATQAAQVMALWYKLSPDESKTFDVLKDEFERHKGHVSSGIFGVKMMFDVLREKNENELAYSVATKKDFPGWGHMLEVGATTLWESWEYPELYASQNHPMFGSISEWFYRSLLGINPMRPGFKKIMIKPQPAGDLQWAKGKYESVQGTIASDWQINGSELTLQVTIPANTTAEVWVLAKAKKVTELLSKTQMNSRAEGDYLVYSVGSGQYKFVSAGFR